MVRAVICVLPSTLAPVASCAGSAPLPAPARPTGAAPQDGSRAKTPAETTDEGPLQDGSTAPPGATPQDGSPPPAKATAAALQDGLTVPDFGTPEAPAVQGRGATIGVDDVEVFGLGWAKDSSEFGLCTTSDGTGGQHDCTYRTPRGGDTGGSYDPDDVADPDVLPYNASLRRRIADKGYGQAPPGAWRFGRDLAIDWTLAERSDPDDEETALVTIRVGAKVKGGAAAAWVLKKELGEVLVDDGGAGAVQLALSPDGKHLGVALYSRCWGVNCLEVTVDVLDATKLAGSAYNMAGLALHRKKEYAAAAELFRKAAFADPKSKVATYNLACALARQGHQETRAALALAIERQGIRFKKKARKDPDFEGVRGEVWFDELTGKGE